MAWQLEWGPYIDDLEAVVEQTGGRIVPDPLKNRPELYVHLMDIVEAVTFCESRGYQMAVRTPVAEISAYYHTFSTFDGSPTAFLQLFKLVEEIHRDRRKDDKENG